MKTIKPLIAASAAAGVLVAGAASLQAQGCGAACGEQYNKIVAPVTCVRFGG
jgi:hypothetical protein